MNRHPLVLQCLVLVTIVATVVPTVRAVDNVSGRLIQFNDNGAWSWFEDERAIVDPQAGYLLVSSVAHSNGIGGSARNGQVDVASFSLTTGQTSRTSLFSIGADDHNSAALMVRPDGRYLAMYSTHGGNPSTRYNISTDPGDPTSWNATQTFTNPANVTYSNLHYLSAGNGGAGRTYNFNRTVNFDPNILVSDNQGDTWSYGGKLLTEGGGGDRPYLKYASNGVDQIHFISTDRHPRDFNNGIYHGYLQDTGSTPQLFNSTGQLQDSNLVDGSGVAPSTLTTVFAADTVVDGDTMTRAWTTDIALDDGGNPYVLFTARANDNDSDHRLFYGRFDGSTWSVQQVAKMGAGLYTPENDYTGLGAVHPHDPNTIYISTPIDPRNEAALAHHEIFKGVTSNGGESWNWTPVTENSTVDNLRPIIPSWNANSTALLWMRGTYNSYTNYDLAVVGTIDSPSLRMGKVQYIDATLANTTRADGLPFNPSGPSNGQGPTDDNWHVRTGFGNDGTVFTSDELGDENAPLLKTTLTDLSDGTYDLFVYFWSNPDENWTIRAGLSADELHVFERANSETAEADDFVDMVTLSGDGNTVLYQGYLGRVSVLDGLPIEIFIDDWSTSQSGQNRTWYDGIGFAPVPPTVPGDFDGDGDVDGADFVIWQTNFPTQEGATLATGDADGDGDVDGADFVIWQTNFPFTPASASASVPEPPTGLLWLLALGGLSLLPRASLSPSAFRRSRRRTPRC